MNSLSTKAAAWFSGPFWAAVAAFFLVQASLAQAPVTWMAPSTRLMWQGTDTGRNMSWWQADNYCQHLQLAGHADWRMPTMAELEGIYDETQDVGGYHVQGNLHLSGTIWSSDTGNRDSVRLLFGFLSGSISAHDRGESYIGSDRGYNYRDGYGFRALCVCRSGE